MATTIEGAAYDALAPSYDLLTADYDYARWIGPLLEAGFDVIGCDESRGMLSVAATKVPDPRAVLRLDMRSLPVLGSFDLITCIDDALNHLLSEDEVRDALASMETNLAPDGLLVFDVNTLATYRTLFASQEVFDVADHTFAWRGLTARDFAA